MAADPPLTHLVLAAASVADDLGFVALADLRTALGQETADCRIIGGHMVTVLAARWQLGAGLYRETGDADLGVPPVVVRARQNVKVSALVLKSLATRVRVKDTDLTDIWRCLEAAFAAGVTPAVFADGIRADSAALIRALFAGRRGPGMSAIAAGQGMTRQAVDIRYTRIRALIARVLGPG
jgi:hypothetical protein